MSVPRPAAKAQLAPPPVGLLIPGADGDVSTGKTRRQIEVPLNALGAPLTALAGAAAVARAAGQSWRGMQLGVIVGELLAAQEALRDALSHLASLETEEV